MAVIDVSDAQFAKLVIEKSRQVPVVVDFWAPWCGPCLSLKPVLERLSSEYERKFVLAKVDVDGNTENAVKYGVSGIPAVKMFKDGKVAAEFTGAKAEKVIREWLESNL
ncbi:MAG: thioredoxin [Candidatus Aenigmatarchaeota archaeon]